MGLPLFSRYRLKQLSNYLVLVLSVNILLENISQNLVQASSTLSTRLAVLNSINNYLMPVAPTMPVFPPVFVGQLSAITTNLTTAMVASAPNPNLFTPALLNNNNGTCSSGIGDCKCLTDGYCAAEYGPLAITNFFALNHRMIAPWIVTDYYKLAFNLLYAGANVNYVLNQPTTAGNFVPPISVPDTPTTLNLLANFFTPDTTTYPGLKLDLDQNGAGSGILIKTPVGTPAGQVSPFCQALVSVNPLNFANPNPNNIWLGGICTNSAAVQALGSHCCGTNLCNTTSGANLGQDTGGNPYGYCDLSCSNLGQGCTSDSSCCTSTGPAACDLKTKVCVSCVIAGDGCLEDSDCCQAQNLKCDQVSFQCVSCVPAGDKALVSTDCCSGTTFDSASQVCQSSCKTVNTACPNGNSDCCASQGLLCSDPTVGNTDGVCLVAPGSTCDPTAEYTPCSFGYVCDATEKKCLPFNGSDPSAAHCCPTGLANCLPQLDPPCANGLTCDAVESEPSRGNLCCVPMGGVCYLDDDCCTLCTPEGGSCNSYTCSKPNGATDATPGTCALTTGQACGQYGAKENSACAIPLICGDIESETGVCCGPPNQNSACKNGDIDCCNGAICDMTTGVDTCVSCINNGNSCAAPHGASNCCSGSCYADKCVKACTSCSTQGEPCMAAPGSSNAMSYASCCNGCGGDALTCDAVTQQCQTCGGPGSVCVAPGDTDPANMCCSIKTGDRTCGYSATAVQEGDNYTCCVNLNFACTQDADCCSSTIGQAYCNSSGLCDIKCIFSVGQTGNNPAGLCLSSAPAGYKSVGCCPTSNSASGLTPTCSVVDAGSSTTVCAFSLIQPGDTCKQASDCKYAGACNNGKCCSNDGETCEQNSDCCNWGASLTGGSLCTNNTCQVWYEDEAFGEEVGVSLAGVIAFFRLVAKIGRYIVENRQAAALDVMGKMYGLDPEDIKPAKSVITYGMFSRGANQIPELKAARKAYAKQLGQALLNKLNDTTNTNNADVKSKMLALLPLGSNDDDLKNFMRDMILLNIQTEAGEIDGEFGQMDPFFLTVKGGVYCLGKAFARLSNVADMLKKIDELHLNKKNFRESLHKFNHALSQAKIMTEANSGKNIDNATFLQKLGEWYDLMSQLMPVDSGSSDPTIQTAKARFAAAAMATKAAATAAGYKPAVQPALNQQDIDAANEEIATNAAKAMADQRVQSAITAADKNNPTFDAIFSADPVDFAKLYFEVMAIRVSNSELVDDVSMAKALAKACNDNAQAGIPKFDDAQIANMKVSKPFAGPSGLFAAATLPSGAQPTNLEACVTAFRGGMPLSVQKAIFLAAGQTFTSIKTVSNETIEDAINASYEYLKDITIGGEPGGIYTYKVPIAKYNDPVIFSF